MLSKLGLLGMRLLALLPLAGVRAVGGWLGLVLFHAVRSRRQVVLVNLRLCFPLWDQAQLMREARQCFVLFAQAWLDRSWLWHAPAAVVTRRITVEGDVSALMGPQGVVVLAPHFMGLDAGWTALAQLLSTPLHTIYTPQTNACVDQWIAQGRSRFGLVNLCRRADGVGGLVAALRRGELLYLLPDMDSGEDDTVFVPFFGVPAATLTSLSRFAKLGRAKVVPVTTQLTAAGYVVRVHPAWLDVPSADVVTDTLTMNQRVAEWIAPMPAQYYWVHKRFKTRPPGASDVYGL